MFRLFTFFPGESDIRAVYCAVVVAKILDIQAPNLFERSIEWIVRCQTYEGGFGGNPGQEAHGGYSFCAAAALYLLKGLSACDLKALLRFVAQILRGSTAILMCKVDRRPVLSRTFLFLQGVSCCPALTRF